MQAMFCPERDENVNMNVLRVKHEKLNTIQCHVLLPTGKLSVLMLCVHTDIDH